MIQEYLWQFFGGKNDSSNLYSFRFITSNERPTFNQTKVPIFHIAHEIAFRLLAPLLGNFGREWCCPGMVFTCSLGDRDGDNRCWHDDLVCLAKYTGAKWV